MPITDDELLLRGLLGDDMVIVRAVAVAIGTNELDQMVQHFLQTEEWLSAALVAWGAASISGVRANLSDNQKTKAALEILEEHELTTARAAQLEFDVSGIDPNHPCPRLTC